MGRGRVFDAEGLQVLCPGSSAKGLMRPVVVEAVGEGVDVLLELIDPVGKFEAAVELVAP